MRDILFKAKRIDNSKWIEGYYFYNPNIDKHFVHNWLSGGLVEVDKNTICQYTGLTDKNGNKIWEQDIVLLGNEFWVVKWDDADAQFTIECEFVVEHFGNVWIMDCEVYSNIFDNPELLEGGADNE